MCEGQDPGVYGTAVLMQPLDLRGEPGAMRPYDPSTGKPVQYGLREVGDGHVQVVHWVVKLQQWFPIVEL